MTEVSPLVIPDPTVTFFEKDGTHPVFSYDGLRLASISSDKKKVTVWEMTSHGLVTYVPPIFVKKEVNCFSFSPINRDVFVSAAEDRTGIMRIDGPDSLVTILGMEHKNPIKSCSFFPDGASVLFAEQNGFICIRYLEKAKFMASFDCRIPIEHVVVAQNGTFFVAITKEGIILLKRRWHWGLWLQQDIVKKGQVLVPNQSVVISPDSRFVIYKQTGKELIQIDLKTKKSSAIIGTFARPIISFTYTCHGRFLLVATSFEIYIYDTATWTRIKYQNFRLEIRQIACSPDGRYIVVEGMEVLSFDPSPKDGLWLLDFGRPHLGTLMEEEAALFI